MTVSRKGQMNLVTTKWYLQQLKNKINHIDWQATKKDIAQFLRPRELISLDVWSKNFFISRVDKLSSYLK